MGVRVERGDGGGGGWAGSSERVEPRGGIGHRGVVVGNRIECTPYGG